MLIFDADPKVPSTQSCLLFAVKKCRVLEGCGYECYKKLDLHQGFSTQTYTEKSMFWISPVLALQCFLLLGPCSTTPHGRSWNRIEVQVLDSQVFTQTCIQSTTTTLTPFAELLGIGTARALDPQQYIYLYIHLKAPKYLNSEELWDSAKRNRFPSSAGDQEEWSPCKRALVFKVKGLGVRV